MCHEYARHNHFLYLRHPPKICRVYCISWCLATWQGSHYWWMERPLGPSTLVLQLIAHSATFIRKCVVWLTGEPWAAGSARRASRRSSAAVGEVCAPRHSWRSCSAVAGVMADLPRTAPADSSQSAPATAAHSPPPTATPRHAGKWSTKLVGQSKIVLGCKMSKSRLIFFVCD